MGEDKKEIKIKENRSSKTAIEPVKNIHSDAKRSIAAVFLIALSIILALGFFNSAGMLGEKVNKLFGFIFGWGKWILPFILLLSSGILLRRKEKSFYIVRLLGLVVAYWSLLGFFHISFDFEKYWEFANMGRGGGIFGFALAYVLVKFTGEIAGIVILGSLFIAGIIATFNFSLLGAAGFLAGIKERISQMFSKKIGSDQEFVGDEPENEDIEEETEEDIQAQAEPDPADNIKNLKFVGDDASPETTQLRPFENANAEIKPAYKIKRADVEWSLPNPNLLEDPKGGAKSGDVKRNIEIIQNTFLHFGIDVEPGDVLIGPTVTQYSFRPAVGVKLSKIVGLGNDLSLALAAHPIRIEAPIPGKSLIGIEVPNKTTAVVRMKEILKGESFADKKTNLTLILGKDVSGAHILGNLEKMPHLMIAGSTGSGKSVCINSILLSLLYQNSPAELNLILVDPKRVELSLYSGIPHLLSEVIVDNHKVINALKWAVGEMEKRYRMLQDTGSRDIASFNAKVAAGEKRHYTDPETKESVEEGLNKLPYIVIIIDELADLMASHGKEVESAIIRLAQMSRAVGIHLIVSTQRPSVEVITGLIKANIITRIAFQVATQIDSRTILDMSGAEKLLGNGDMLFVSASSPKPKRLQGVYVSESEVKKVVKFIKDQHRNNFDDNIGEDIAGSGEPEGKGSGGIDFDSYKNSPHAQDEDALYEQAKNLVLEMNKASTSFLQRHLRVGYSRAARLIDTLEEKGIIGPANGSKAREIIAGVEDSSGSADVSNDNLSDQKWNL